MSNTKSHLILASAFLVLFAAPVCFADLMCYVCADCQKVSKDTPLLACNEDFFNQGGSTEASTVTTTTASSTMTTEPVETTTTTPGVTNPPQTSSETTTPTTTKDADITTTEQATTEITETTESTEAPIPTPATVGPPETTTGVPTPPNTDLAREVTRLAPVDNTKPEVVTSMPELPIRQRRAVINTDVSYHCYTVQKTINNTVQTERGCSRVPTDMSVCKDLEMQNAAVQLSNCDPCSMNACNSATSVLQSTMLATFLLVLFAAVLQ